MLLGGCVEPNIQFTPVVNFDVDLNEVNPGSPITLHWNVTGASSITIDNGIGTVRSVGEITVTPMADTTYTITAVNASGQSIKSISVKVKTIPNILPKDTYKTYSETIYDFVEKAPTATWSENSMSGEPGYWEELSFPISSPIGSLKYWDNIILEDGNSFKKSLFIELYKRKILDSTKYHNTTLTGEYPVSIPQNSWFTAKIAFPKLVNPPENKPLIRFWVNYTMLSDNQVYALFSSVEVSYDNYVDQVDIDLSQVYGGDLSGTNGYITLIFSNELDTAADFPIAVTDIKIAR
jgi:hypothetical protein